MSPFPHRALWQEVDVLLVSLKLGPTGHRNVHGASGLARSVSIDNADNQCPHGIKEEMRRTLPSV